uniref:Apolipoprotein B n=1 Tax=Sinocyclocheilus rhinocerous TaxID=307959 RepID=A0A673MD31_9TELE
ITSSISSPAAGFIGFQFTRRSPSQFYAKLFSRYLVREPDEFQGETLKNSEKLSIQIGYHINGLSKMINGLKDRLPSIIASLHKFINQYHVDHLGMDLNHAALKLKNALSNGIDRAYQEIPRMTDALQTSVEQLKQQGNKMCRRMLENLPQIDLYPHQQPIPRMTQEVLHQDTKFHLPGLEEKLTGQELYNRIRKSISKAIDRATTRFFSLIEAIADTVSGHINKIAFTVPGTTKVISGKNILKDLRSAMKSAKDQIMPAIEGWENLKVEKVFQDLLNSVKIYIQKAEEFLNSLKTEKLEEISSHISGIYREAGNLQVMQKIREWMREPKRGLSKLKDFSKIKIQELYNEISMEKLISNLNDLLMVIDSYVSSLLKSYIVLMKSLPSYTEPYVRVSN